MSTVPPLSELSAARLDRVMSRVADVIEHSPDTDPNPVLAKAASDEGLPFGHIPFIVRAYNTSRAAGRMAASLDPWERAAPYKQASVQRVAEALGQHVTPVAKQSVDGPLDDYAFPPEPLSPELPDVKAFGDYLGVQPTPVVKQASAPDTRVSPSLGDVVGKLGLLVGKAVALGEGMTPSEYTGVMKIASAVDCKAADLIGSKLVNRYPGLKVAARPDPTIRPDHLLVRVITAVGKLAAVVPVPAKPQQPSLLSRAGKSLMGGTNQLLNGVTSRLRDVNHQLISDNPEASTSALFKPFGQFKAQMKAVGDRRSAEYGKIVENQVNEQLQKQVSPGKEVPQELKHLGRVETINELLQDPRFKTEAPDKVVRAYQSMAGLAPTIMENPAVAGDFVHRVMQTGPLNYYDLGQLVSMEKAHAEATKARRANEDMD